jgi:twitching motility protein PilJ
MASVNLKKQFDNRWLIYVLAALTIACGIFLSVNTAKLMLSSSNERVWTTQAARVQVDSQRLAKAAVEAALGNFDAFTDLSLVHRQIKAHMLALGGGSADSGLPAVPLEVAGELNQLQMTWESVDRNTEIIIQADPLIQSLSEASSSYLASMSEIQATIDRMIRQLIESGAPNQQVFAASRQLVLSDRIQRRVGEILQNNDRSARSAEQLREEMALFEQTEAALMEGNQRFGIPRVLNPQARASLLEAGRQYKSIQPQLQLILSSAEKLNSLRSAADQVFLQSDEMFDHANALVMAISGLSENRSWPSTSANTIGLVAFILLAAALVALVLQKAGQRAEQAHRSNRKTQQAIVKLLDELGAVAQGDLTVHATVTDEITGAIADAVNYAVEQLRELVIRINRTSKSVAESAETTRAATSAMAESANEQAGQVARATEKIQTMSSAFDSMATRTRESSETARQSVSVASSGAQKVRKTITGMDVIREQIQETSKRIKRLGESTQEIGDIVGMINDIAEQTNVLALNAAIQAASAGGSGQGFGVVADEVQQLAESATNATRRISVLVQAIQADTGEAIRSMEATTSEVVNGARLARDAGTALQQMEQASNELAALIQEVSSEAAEHSHQAERISELMGGIRAIALKTSQGTSSTADAVAELAKLVMQLQASVADFHLPAEKGADSPKELPQITPTRAG